METIVIAISGAYLISMIAVILVYENRIAEERKQSRSQGFYEGFRHKVLSLPESPEDQE